LFCIGWIDINLTVTPESVPLLFTLLADPSLPIRLATSVALLRIISKGLKEPSDKLQLLKVLSLGQVLDALEEKTRAQQVERGEDTDEGEESYREALGKLLNVLGLELAKLVDVSAHTTTNRRVPLMNHGSGSNGRSYPRRIFWSSSSDPTRYAALPGG
jgi:exportin-T